MYVCGTHAPIGPLPAQPDCPQLAHHVLKRANPLGGACKHEAGLTPHEISPSGVDVLLIGLKFDGQHGDVVVELMIAGNLPSQTSVVSLGHNCL
jgi:hypothetical protein